MNTLDAYPHPVIFFDGVCNLCNASVQRVIRNDKKRLFRFASLQGKTGQALLAQFELPSTSFNSFLLWQNGQLYTRSTAALRVTKQMDGAWPLLYYLCIWIPPFIRNAVYDLIARNRYKWFGKQESCWLPNAELKPLFLQ